VAVFDAFVGGSYESRSLAFDAQRSMNLYIETDETGKGKSKRALMGTPGLELFGTLPTSPLRGIWTGLADTMPGSTVSDLCNAVGGSKLYSVARGGSPTLIGDVGTDAANSPCTFQVNGAQLLISSAGKLWVYDGSGLSQAYFNNGNGTVNTSGTTVTWVTGSPFDQSQVGSGISINGTIYIISAVASAGTSLTLTGSAGTQTNVPFFVLAGGAQINTSGALGTFYVEWMSGDQFANLAAGQQVVLNGAVYTIAAVQSATQFSLTTNPGLLYDVSMSFSLPVPAGQTAFLDTYFIAAAPNSKSVAISAVQDGRTWNPLDNKNKEGFPDDVNAILTDHEQLWVFGTETTEVWADTGGTTANTFPLQRSQFISTGITAPFTAVNLLNGVAWLGGDARGGNPTAWYADGYIPKRVSTHAIEEQWGSYAKVSDATAYVYTMDGHQFWVISFPTGNATWVYDIGEDEWHERGAWNGSGFDRHLGGCHGYAFGLHLVGDYSSGNIYRMDPELYQDNGSPIYRIRTAPHLSEEEEWSVHHRFRLSMQAGPTPLLSWSDDLGESYNSTRLPSGRTFGAATQQSEWRRLGKTRSRVYSVLITDNVEVAINTAYIDPE
jgi:hypothetical protein